MSRLPDDIINGLPSLASLARDVQTAASDEDTQALRSALSELKEMIEQIEESLDAEMFRG